MKISVRGKAALARSNSVGEVSGVKCYRIVKQMSWLHASNCFLTNRSTVFYLLFDGIDNLSMISSDIVANFIDQRWYCKALLFNNGTLLPYNEERCKLKVVFPFVFLRQR